MGIKLASNSVADAGAVKEKGPEGPLQTQRAPAPGQAGQAADKATALSRRALVKPNSSGPRVFLVWVQP